MLDNVDSKTDEELMLLCKEGIEDAFTVLYLRYRLRILKFATQMLGHYEDAEDIFQETFKYIFSKIYTYKPTAKFSTLLYQVARNLCIDILRKRHHHNIFLEEQKLQYAEEVINENSLSTLEAREIEDVFAKTLNEISEVYREVLFLRLVEELSYEEIGAITQCPIGTVKSRIHSGIEELRKILKKKGIEG